ncbi:MAG: SDR family oxidoreductase [Spirochaetes bacterium]|nr:SDR family oxidoreductase [Spirochaetota bacterium]
MELKNKVALITGSTGGLGWRICSALAKEGMKLSMVYYSSEEKAKKNLTILHDAGHEARIIRADITQEKGIETMVEETFKTFGRIDCLVLDAAYNIWIPFQNLMALDTQTWNYILNYNLTSPYLTVRKVAPLMKQQGSGRIVLVTSIAGLSPTGSSIAYAVSKAALIHLTKCLAVALAPEILVNNVAPGMMEGTKMTENLAPDYIEQVNKSSALKRAADKDDVADAVTLLLKTDSITGQTLVIDSGRVFH